MSRLRSLLPVAAAAWPFTACASDPPCNPWLIRYDPRLTGEALSIYEQSDDIGRSCRPLAARSPRLTRFEEMALRTGLGHGLVYRPLEAWVDPAAAWASRPE